MIKLAGFFALWEAAKMIIGSEFLHKDKSIMPVIIVTLEVPYFAWGVWLLFTHLLPALIVWGLGFSAIVVYAKWRAHYQIFHRFDCAICAVTLTLIALGKIS